ncbi:MAG: hypothetical protein NVSMB62_25350 [Acidobacteriaceae bacterium]
MGMRQTSVSIRVARPEDSEVCGRIWFDAFLTLNAAHGFPCDFPGPEVKVSSRRGRWAGLGPRGR